MGDILCLGSRTRWMSHSYQTPPSSITPPAAYPTGLLSALCTQLLLDKQKALHNPTGLPGHSSAFQGDVRAEPLSPHTPKASSPSSSTFSCLNLTIYKVVVGQTCIYYPIARSSTKAANKILFTTVVLETVILPPSLAPLIPPLPLCVFPAA